MDNIYHEEDFRGKDVLEVGAGSGSFTLSNLTGAKSILAVDSDAGSLFQLGKEWDFSSKLECVHSDIESLKLPKSTFDIAVFSHSF